MMHTYKAAPDVDVVTSIVNVGGFGNLAINAFVIHAAEPVLVDTGTVVDSDDFMGALRIVDRSGRPSLDLVDPHGLRPHRLPAPPARRERTVAGGHQLPRGRDHGTGGTAADGAGLPGQSGPDGRRRRPDPDRGTASGLRQSDHHGSAGQPFGHLLQLGLLRGPLGRGARQRRGSERRGAASRARSSGRPWTRRGCTRSIGGCSPRNWTASAPWRPPWS